MFLPSANLLRTAVIAPGTRGEAISILQSHSLLVSLRAFLYYPLTLPGRIPPEWLAFGRRRNDYYALAGLIGVVVDFITQGFTLC